MSHVSTLDLTIGIYKGFRVKSYKNCQKFLKLGKSV